MSCLLSVGIVWAMVAVPYQIHPLHASASVWDVVAQDLTGDGLADLVMVCCDEKGYPLEKFVAVHIANADGGYPAQPSVRLDLEQTVSTLFFAEVDGDAPKELIAADAAGATVYRYSAGEFVEAAAPRFVTLFPSGSKEPVFLDTAAEDLDGDGIDEWIVPVPAGYEIRGPAGLIRRIPCDIVSEYRRDGNGYIIHRLPACHVFPLEGETRKSLAFLSDEFADFAYGDGWSKHSRFRIPLNLDEKWEASAKMEDLDANGFPDLVVTQMKGTIHLRAVTHVYLASAPFTYPEQPSATFETKSAVSSPSPVDIDGNGQTELVFVSVPFGVKNIVNYFVRGKVSAQVDVYLFEEGGFGDKPASSETFTLDAPEGRERVAYTVGDFNGDGRIDVAFGSGADKVAIHTGSAGRFISPRAWVTLELPSFGVARPYDLNGNDSKDLVLFHPGGENKRQVEVVVF